MSVSDLPDPVAGVTRIDRAQVLACPGGVELLLGRAAGDHNVRLDRRVRLDDAAARALLRELRAALEDPPA